MKQILPPANASFAAAAAQIVFNGTVPASISHILHISNITRGVIYFQPQAGPAFGGTYANGLLALSCSTAGHADNDKLLIFYDDGQSMATETTLGLVRTAAQASATEASALALKQVVENVEVMTHYMKQLLGTLSRPPWLQPNGKIRVMTEAADSNMNVINSLTTVSQLEGQPAFVNVLRPLDRTSFGSNLRSRIT